METPIQQAAARLRQAAESRIPCAPIRDLIGEKDVESAYAVQEVNVRHRISSGGRVVGRKIGLTAIAVQKQLGVGEPDFGFLFSDMFVPANETIPFSALMQPKA